MNICLPVDLSSDLNISISCVTSDEFAGDYVIVTALQQPNSLTILNPGMIYTILANSDSTNTLLLLFDFCIEARNLVLWPCYCW